MAEKPTKNSPAFGTLRPYEPGLLEGIGAQLQDFMVDRAGVSRPVARDLAGAVGFSRPEEAPVVRATDVLGGPAGVAVAGADFVEDPGFLTGIGVPLSAIPLFGGPLRRGLRGLGGNGGPPMDDDGLAEAVQAAREARKAPAQERARIKPEAENTIFDEEYLVDYEEEKLVDRSDITSVSKVRQELESIGMGANPWDKQKVVKELNKRGVTNDQMEASGITALLDRKPNVTKEELVAQHERFAPQITVESRAGQDTTYAGQQRIMELAEGTSEYDPVKHVNYSEVVFRNQNPEISAEFTTAGTHGMGGFKGSRGELAHARTSEYMEPGVGRVELIEEVQSDLFKTYQNNLDAKDPSKTMKAIKSASRNARVLADASTPKAEEAAELIEGVLADSRYEIIGDRAETMRRTAKRLRTHAQRYKDKIDFLDNRVKMHPNDPDLVAETVRELRDAEGELASAWSSSNNLMYDLATSVNRRGGAEDKALANKLTDFRTLETTDLQGGLSLLMRDASRAQNKAIDAVDMQVLPQMSPRVVERAEDPKFQELYSKYEEMDRKATTARQEAGRSLEEAEKLREKVKEEHARLDRYEEREISGVEHPSLKDASPVMRERILKGDKENMVSGKARIKNLEKRIDALESTYDSSDSIAASSRLKREEYERRMKTADEDSMAFYYLQVRSGRRGRNQINPINPSMPFSSLNDTTQFVYETMFERALSNSRLNGVVLPDYRDIASVPSRGTGDMPEAFKVGYKDAPEAVIKRLKERYPGIEVSTTKLPGAEFPATMIKFPKERGTGKPLIQGYAQGGLVMKGIGSMGKEVL
tara:strand:- start:4453 stop:6906 length:2454 start_codon:yes stop_codon:yes gene_type:complete